MFLHGCRVAREPRFFSPSVATPFGAFMTNFRPWVIRGLNWLVPRGDELPAHSSRRLHCEPLEDRRLLAIDFEPLADVDSSSQGRSLTVVGDTLFFANANA